MDDLSINLTDIFTACDQAETLGQVGALMGILASHLNTLPEESVEARQITSELAKLGLKKNMLGPIVKEEPLAGGTQTGKRIVTFADGTKAIFKPASGEVGHKAKD
jgi:hypothetical protein